MKSAGRLREGATEVDLSDVEDRSAAASRLRLTAAPPIANGALNSFVKAFPR